MPTAVENIQGAKGLNFTNPGSLRGFNPQPDPPGDKGGFTNPGMLKGFNPQPEPPGIPTLLLPAVQKRS